MTFLIIYSTILTAGLMFIFWNKFFGKGRMLNNDIAKLEAENEYLKIQHSQDIKKLQEAFGGDIEMDNINDIIDSQSDKPSRKRPGR